jgi:hypothetical protein
MKSNCMLVIQIKKKKFSIYNSDVCIWTGDAQIPVTCLPTGFQRRNSGSWGDLNVENTQTFTYTDDLFRYSIISK